ncbi:hypothetical protein CSPHI_09675 [Corynebacterium sphenisci DSM 44792]|uniref:Phage shock protein PspC N-terminal domain-containing protein n=1 Tax=Corynebacterium sphenisci DSM 44792 TaxID=1437874 RepID=A0A1L7CZH4_9CORY|nr:PspC domain-containing protein [Corynebacterium sphenisci]APT91230.1 hypothetical protein CSPHI_09675 [Corynebacterium sphenisci DSM 44792]
MSPGPPATLRRSRTDRMLAGVLAGIGQWLGIPPNRVRLAFLISLLLPGPQAALYLIGWLLIPDGEPPRD